ncbi:MAG TPA: hypothetical protein VNA25_02365 [Phycisphaerae bacterium]|nr:hypothetical protein [Phycisphaerae bacterium]
MGSGSKTFVARNTTQALAHAKALREGDTLYLLGAIDLTGAIQRGDGITVPPGATLAGIDGATIICEKAPPDGRCHAPVVALADAVVRGLTIIGPNGEEAVDGPLAWGVGLNGPRATIMDCRLSGWSVSAVAVTGNADQAVIRRCWIRDCRKSGHGYGVQVDAGEVLIADCDFDRMRRPIACTGRAGRSYTAVGNRIGPTRSLDAFDVHADPVSGEFAGEWFRITRNRIEGTNWGMHIGAVPRQPELCAFAWNNMPELSDPKAVVRQAAGKRMVLGKNWLGGKLSTITATAPEARP